MKIWNESYVDRAVEILRDCSPENGLSEALEIMNEEFPFNVTGDSLYNAFRRNGNAAPTEYLGKQVRVKPPKGKARAVPTTEVSEAPETIQRLVKLVKKPLSFSALCDKLDMSPSKAKELLKQAKAYGAEVHIEHDHIGIKPSEPSDHVQKIGVAPVVGTRQKVGVISDTHLGSKYCLRPQLQEFIHYAYEQGVREILHPGDVLDGMYRHGLWEVSHAGLDEQANDLFETLPSLPGLKYRCITGNHDFTFTDASGVDVGNYLVNHFQQRGRHDLHFYGNRGAFVKVNGAVVHLWHPRSSPGYARSYGIQKQIERYTVVKPHILLVGHWHVFNYCYERGVHGIACPTFQGGGSAFGKSLGGSPAIGGLILSWDVTEHGTLRSFLLEKRSYFEVEKPVELENPVDGVLLR